MRSSRQVGAGSRGRVTADDSPTSHHNSVVSQNSGAPAQRRATQRRPCARADTTRPATANYPPVRKERLSRGFPSKEPPQQFHHTTICTSHHHIIAYYIARTDRPDGRRVTRHLENERFVSFNQKNIQTSRRHPAVRARGGHRARGAGRASRVTRAS